MFFKFFVSAAWPFKWLFFFEKQEVFFFNFLYFFTFFQSFCIIKFSYFFLKTNTTMQWEDEGFILKRAAFGENGFVIHILTRFHGRHCGLWRGSLQKNSHLQLGAFVHVVWRSRVCHQLGYWSLEPGDNRELFAVLSNKQALLGLNTLTALCLQGLHERQEMPHVYASYIYTMRHLREQPQHFIFFELTLLQEAGYGLELDTCAVTGRTTGLTHVSPVSGKVVCAEVAKPYKHRLLPFPDFLRCCGNVYPQDVAVDELKKAFHLTAFFLKRYIFGAKKDMPPARSYFLWSLYKNLQTYSLEKKPYAEV